MSEITLNACPICASGAIRLLEPIDYPSAGQRLGLWRCGECRITFLNPRFESSDLAYSPEHVQRYLRQLVADGLLREDYTPVLDRIRLRYRELADLAHRAHQGGEVIDIGCGLGMSMLALRYHGIQAVGIDVNEHMVCTGRDVLGLDVRRIGVDDLTTRYALATLSSCLEHVFDPVGFLTTIRQRALVPGGRLVVTVPNLLDISYIVHRTRMAHAFHGGHVWYFTEETLGMVAEKAGFDVGEFYRHDFELPDVLGSAMRFVRELAGLDLNLYGAIGCTLTARSSAIA